MDDVDSTPSAETPATGPRTSRWPRLLSVRPARVVGTVAALVALAWIAFLLVDILNVGGLGERLERPLWWHLFNDRPVEWSQWFLLAATTLGAGYLAGRLAGAGSKHAWIGSFFFLFGIATGLMLIEEAGDIRHTLSTYVLLRFGEEIGGIPHKVVSDVPYFAALAAVPVYALVRYGRRLWRVRAVRGYLAAGYGLYGLAAGASGVRHLGDLYLRLGRAIDEGLLGGRLPLHPHLSPEQTHFLLVDGPIEESVELLAAACLFAVVVGFARYLRDQATTGSKVLAVEVSEARDAKPLSS